MAWRAALLAVAVAVLTAPAWADADVDNDGDFDSDDVAAFFAAWADAHRTPPGPNAAVADLNRDGTVNWRDAIIFTRAVMMSGLPPVTLADYFPIDEGQVRLWRKVGSDWELLRETTDASQNLAGVVNDTVANPFLDTVRLMGLRHDDQGRLVLVELHGGGRMMRLNAPDGVLLPAVLRLRQPVTRVFTATSPLGRDLGQGTLEIAAVEADVRVTTPAGVFEGCVRVEMTVTVGTTTVSVRWWLARGIGPVKWTDLSASPRVSYTLLWASVGGQDYGRRATVSIHGTFPAQTGNFFIWRDADTGELFGERFLGAGQVSSYQFIPLAEFDLPWDTAPADVWMISGGFVTGYWGWRSEDGTVTRPLPVGFEWPASMALGDVLAWSAPLNTGRGRWDESLMPVATNVSVSTPAGQFDGCYVIALAVTAYDVDPITGLAMLSRDDRRYLWIKPGLGPVRCIRWLKVHLGPAHRTERELYYARVGTSTHGQRPALAYADALNIADGNCWGYASGQDWLVETANLADLGGRTAIEVFTAEGVGPGATITRHFWDTSGGRLTYLGYIPDPVASPMPPGALVAVDPPMVMRATMPMGATATYHCRLVRTDTGDQVGTMRVQMLYTASSPATDTHVVKVHTTVTDAQGARVEQRIEQHISPQLGRVLERRQISGPQGTSEATWQMQWAKVGATQHDYPAAINTDDYMAYGSWGKWIFGDAQVGYTRLRVEPAVNLAGVGEAFPLVMTPLATPDQAEAYYRAASGGRPSRSIVAYRPPGGQPAIFDKPLVLPAQWSAGQLVRHRTTMTIGSPPLTTSMPVEHFLLQVAPTAVATDAGIFQDAVRFVEVSYMDLTPLGGSPRWVVAETIYARDVGPVWIYERRTGDPVADTPGPLVYAAIPSGEYGQPP